MAHGYLGDGYGSHGEIDPDRDDRGERGWRGRDDDWRDRDRGMMFADRDRGRSGDDRWKARGGDRESYSANPDDHYRSWRDRHMSELDRDYQDYCREREQQFHREFNDWRTHRQSGIGANETSAYVGELELTHERALAEEGNTPTPVENATLGTNNSENTLPGRARGRR